MSKKILTVGDLHFRESLSYSEYVKDRRDPERQEILDFIVKSAEDCGSVVLLGDIFDHKNNSAEVVRSFVEFVKKFGEKQIYMISGNHSKKGDGKTAIDFMKEIQNPNWHVMTTITTQYDVEGLVVDFLPFMLKSDLGVETDVESTEKIMDSLGTGRVLFHHHMIEGLSVNNLVITDQFKEPILPKKRIEKMYDLVIGGHIHAQQNQGNIWVAGNVFNANIGDMGKRILKVNVDDLSVEHIDLPGRKLYNLVNPTAGDLVRIDTYNIVKVVVTDRDIDIEGLKKLLSNFSAYILSEQYPNRREKIHFEEGAIDMDIDKLLKIYSDEKKVDFTKLMSGWEIIK